MHKYLFFILGIFFILRPASAVFLGGRIILETEKNGEAWYVEPESGQRYFLGRPAGAFELMRVLGRGISNADLAKIRVGFVSANGRDSDGDGLEDALEEALGADPDNPDSDGDGHGDRQEMETGFDPLGPGKAVYDDKLAGRLSGGIFLQVENKGEAWYVNPEDMKRYYMGRPAGAFELMRGLGLGVSEEDILKIPAASEDENFIGLERLLHDKVNLERESRLISSLKWNSELAQVAKAHSESLAKENSRFSGMGKSCDYPMIHHEDIELGFYNKDRLNENGIHYFSSSGENIALYSALTYMISFEDDSPAEKEMEQCPAERERLGRDLKSRLDSEEDEGEKKMIIEEEIEKRTRLYNEKAAVEAVDLNWYGAEHMAGEISKGWMESQGHRENILNADYDEAGLGISVANGYIYATQVFIKRADCGYQGGRCCREAGYLPYCYIPLSCADSICQASQ